MADHLAIVELLQSSLQRQYDLDIPYQVTHFVSHDAGVAQQLADGLAACERGMPAHDLQPDIPQETVFIRQSDDSLEFTLYLDHQVLHTACESAGTNSDSSLLSNDAHSLDCLCTVVEGVSHAVCLLWHAHNDRQLRAVDLELQAEVDKYMMLLNDCPDGNSRVRLHEQLFDHATFTSPIGSELYRRYKAASDSAAAYCNWLVNEYPGEGDREGLQQELARFYRLSGTAKFDRIKRLH